MAREGKAYLTELVESVICVPDAFRIRCGNDNFIFSIQSKNQETNDYFAISAIYDTICTIDSAIKFAFAEAIAIDLPESLDTYNPFSQIGEDERIAIYHVENIVFRVSILWDMLAQLCNIIYQTKVDLKKLHCGRYFDAFSKGDKSFEFAKEVNDYLEEKEDTSIDANPWPGNHAFLANYRNQMTHRVSPFISSISTFGHTLRPPTMYLLHRAVEDYYKVSSFLCRLVNQYLDEHQNWLPFGLEKSEEDE